MSWSDEIEIRNDSPATLGPGPVPSHHRADSLMQLISLYLSKSSLDTPITRSRGGSGRPSVGLGALTGCGPGVD